MIGDAEVVGGAPRVRIERKDGARDGGVGGLLVAWPQIGQTSRGACLAREQHAGTCKQREQSSSGGCGRQALLTADAMPPRTVCSKVALSLSACRYV